MPIILENRRHMKNTCELDNDKLLLGLKRGEMYCFEILFRKYKGKIYNFIMNVSQGNTYLAEEITQNVFLKIWEKRSDLSIKESFSAFLYTMSKNMYYNYIRRKIRQQLYEESLLISSNNGCYNMENNIESQMLEKEIEKLIGMLSPARKRVYQLRRQGNKSNKEIEGILRISENTVESHITKANSFIRNALSEIYI